MPVPLLSDANRQSFQDIQILVNGANLAPKYVVWAYTTFDMVAGAMPGSGLLVLRDPDKELDFQGGEAVKVIIDGHYYYTGFALTIGMGYWFEDKVGTQDVSGRRWDLGCVDLNLVLDKLYTYNHDNLAAFPDGGGTFPRGVVPVGTTDRQYLVGALKDTDLDLIRPAIDFQTRVSETAVIVTGPDKGQLMGAGAVVRAVIADAAGNANKAAQGSMVWYIDPQAYLVYRTLDTNVAPFSVSDGGGGVAVRGLSIGRSIATIKNDVIIFATDLNPDPESKQDSFLFRHNSLTSSIARYGRFQYAESLPGFLQNTINARSIKILTQEGTPGISARFSAFRPGLLAGQIVTVASSAFGFTENLPIRQVTISFVSPNLARFDVIATFDTQDPWGLIMALRRPPTRGFVPPRFDIVRMLAGDEVVGRMPYTQVTETPKALGGNVYQCSYGYIRYSIQVHAAGLRLVSNDGVDSGASLVFNETAPEKGTFRLYSAPGGAVTVTYHVANNL